MWIELLTASAFIISFKAGADEGQYLPSELTLADRPTGLNAAIEASHELWHLDWSRCSASVVSPEGYVLTAAHCVKDCAIAHQLLSSESHESPRWSLDLVKNQVPQVDCPDLILKTKDGELTRPRLIVLGRGIVSFRGAEVLQIPDDRWAQLVASDNDFAVLKFEVKKPLPCVPPQKIVPNVGDRIWAVGFPADTTRRNHHQSRGWGLYVTLGSRLSPEVPNDYVIEQKFSPEHVARLREHYSSKGKIIGNLDLVPGLSGSMTINAEGELIGENFGVTLPSSTVNHDRYVAGTSATLGIDAIFAEINKAFGARGESMIQKIFACKTPQGGHGLIKK